MITITRFVGSVSKTGTSASGWLKRLTNLPPTEVPAVLFLPVLLNLYIKSTPVTPKTIFGEEPLMPEVVDGGC